jgi:hypothetical protein
MTSALFAPESLILILTAFVVFKGFGPFRFVPSIVTNKRESIATDMVLRLTLTIVVSLILMSLKWIVTGTSSITLFPVLFVSGSIAAIVRYLITITLTANFKVDSLVLLATLIVSVGAALYGATWKTPLSIISVTMIEESAVMLSALLMISVGTYRSVFVYNELSDSKLFHSNESKVEYIYRINVAGLSPFVLLMVLGYIPATAILSGCVCIWIGCAGLLSSPGICRYWSAVEIMKGVKSSEIKYASIIFPFVLLVVVGIATLASQSYVTHVTVASSTVGAYLPGQNTVSKYADFAAHLVLMVVCTGTLVTICYKRLLSILIRFS